MRLKNLGLVAWRYQYSRIALALVALLGGIWLWLLGLAGLAHVVWVAGAILSLVEPVRDMVSRARQGDLGLDILAIIAATSAIGLGEYLAAAVIACMLTGGEALEDYAERRASRALRTLLSGLPTTAHQWVKQQVKDCPIDDLRPGDIIIIQPGEVVPVDCEIIMGQSSFDQAPITGESAPASHSIGDQLFSGVINQDEVVRARVLRSGQDSQYQRIVDLVKASTASRSPLERLASKYSLPFTVVALLIAGLAWALTHDPLRALAVLVVATPCPLLLATPVAIVSGMNRAAWAGIILKDGGALERLASIRALAFDKTGTLTSGRPAVTKILTSGIDEDELLTLVASVEQDSGHVLAKTLVAAARARQLPLLVPESVKELSGEGLVASVSGEQVYVGSKKFVSRYAHRWPSAFDNVATSSSTMVFVARGNRFIGAIVCADELRPETPRAVHELRRLGVSHLIILTGDQESVARPIAEQLGIHTLRAELLPEGKVKALRSLASNWRPIGMIGDGINDAPTLAAADVGIAMAGDQPTAASESADVIILHQDLSRLPLGLALSRRTLKIARQSIIVGLSLSTGLMLVAAAGLIRPVYGAFMQEAVDVAVILNALRASWPAKF